MPKIKSMQIKKGDTVRVHYTGRLVNGEQFDSSVGREPLEFEVGAGMMIKGFDNAVVGMAMGEKKTINVNPEEGYGPRNEEMVMDFPRADFPAHITPEEGMQLMMNNNSGQQFPVTVVEVTEAHVKLDANHFLSGKELVFDIEVVGIDPKSLIITE